MFILKNPAMRTPDADSRLRSLEGQTSSSKDRYDAAEGNLELARKKLVVLEELARRAEDADFLML